MKYLLSAIFSCAILLMGSQALAQVTCSGLNIGGIGSIDCDNGLRGESLTIRGYTTFSFNDGTSGNIQDLRGISRLEINPPGPYASPPIDRSLGYPRIEDYAIPSNPKPSYLQPRAAPTYPRPYYPGMGSR